MEPAFSSAVKLVRALRARRIGALELLDHYADRIARHDGQINAIPVRDFERARKRAKAFDRRGAQPAPLGGGFFRCCGLSARRGCRLR